MVHRTVWLSGPQDSVTLWSTGQFGFVVHRTVWLSGPQDSVTLWSTGECDSVLHREPWLASQNSEAHESQERVGCAWMAS